MMPRPRGACPMRIMLLVVLLALVTGCADDSDTPPTATGPTNSSPAPAPEPTAEPTPEPTAEPTPTPEPTPPTAAPPAPVVVLDETFDFSRDGDATGQSPKATKTKAVPEGYATVLLNVSLERANPAPTALPVSGSVNQPKIHVFAPDGTEVLLIETEGQAESKSVPAQQGAWTVRYDGAGTMRAIVTLTAFP